jgi:hypothetical protein
MRTKIWRGSMPSRDPTPLLYTIIAIMAIGGAFLVLSGCAAGNCERSHFACGVN